MPANTDFTAGQVLTAAQQNNFPRGLMGSVTRTTSVTALGTAVADITGMSITFTAVTGRNYKATWTISGTKVSTSGYTDIAFTTSGNVQVGGVTNYAVAGNFWNCSGSAIFTASSGSVTYKLRGAAENNTSAPSATAGTPIYFMIEDIGAA